jgi:formylglycine-generating enzyme required for sulfatase activity
MDKGGKDKNQTSDFMKSKLYHLFIVLAWFTSGHSALAQVTNLGIAQAGGQSIIYWPANTKTNYVLQTTASLASPNWTSATNAGTVNAVVVTNTAPSGYFRLDESTPPVGMTLIPAGSFLMGNFVVNNFYNSATNDPDITDATPTNVYVSAFYMDVNLVSSNQWEPVYKYATNQGYQFDDAGEAVAPNNPVNFVDWFDAVLWSNARSQQAGLTPVYYADAGFTQVLMARIPNVTVYQNLTNNGYRLPTEAEWEKAARGGLSGNRFPWGNIITEDQADYEGAPTLYNYDSATYSGYNTNFDTGSLSAGYTSPVGSFAPNGYGLYDMAGNLFEWCWDWYAAPPYPAGSPYLGGANPTGPATGSFRLARGSSWIIDASFARCAYRHNNNPDSAQYATGFRCVRGF